MKLGTQVWGLITVVVVIALVAGGYFLGIAPFLDQQAKAEVARKAALAENQVLESEILQLEQASKNLGDYQDLAADYEKLIPETVDSQRFIRSLDSLAAANGVTITKIAIDRFLPYEAPPIEEGVEYSEKAPPPFADSRITDKNFVIVPISVSVDGGWAESLNFVHQLQFSDRLVLLTSIEQSMKDAVYTTDVTAYMYVLVKPGTPVPGEEVVEEGSEVSEPTEGETAAARG